MVSTRRTLSLSYILMAVDGKTIKGASVDDVHLLSVFLQKITIGQEKVYPSARLLDLASLPAFLLRGVVLFLSLSTKTRMGDAISAH